MAGELVWEKHDPSIAENPCSENAVVMVIYRNKQSSYQPMTAKCFNWNNTGSDWDVDFYSVLKP